MLHMNERLNCKVAQQRWRRDTSVVYIPKVYSSMAACVTRLRFAVVCVAASMMLPLSQHTHMSEHTVHGCSSNMNVVVTV